MKTDGIDTEAISTWYRTLDDTPHHGTIQTLTLKVKELQAEIADLKGYIKYADDKQDSLRAQRNAAEDELHWARLVHVAAKNFIASDQPQARNALEHALMLARQYKG